jgi:hypothetical protein
MNSSPELMARLFFYLVDTQAVPVGSGMDSNHELDRFLKTSQLIDCKKSLKSPKASKAGLPYKIGTKNFSLYLTPALPTDDRRQRGSAWRSKSSNVPHRRLAEEAAVFTVELARALITNRECRARRV